MKISYEKKDFIPAPDHWPNRYNACTDPCDMIKGPCACGGWHNLEEKWVKIGIVKYGFYDFIVGYSMSDFDLKRENHDS